MFPRRLNVFGVEKKLSILVLLWKIVLLDWYLIHLRLFAIYFYQRLRNILSLLYNCSYENHVYHYSDGAVTLTDLRHTNVLGNAVHTKVTKAAIDFIKLK